MVGEGLRAWILKFLHGGGPARPRGRDGIVGALGQAIIYWQNALGLNSQERWHCTLSEKSEGCFPLAWRKGSDIVLWQSVPRRAEPFQVICKPE